MSLPAPRCQQQGITPVIPSRCNRQEPREYDQEGYKARHLIETFFANLTTALAIATRYDKLAESFLGASIWL
ncbi:MAG: transposase [Elainellaceae cyanobacterium]